MYHQVLDPVSHSLGLTSIFAVLPLLVLLGVVRMKAQWAALITLPLTPTTGIGSGAAVPGCSAAARSGPKLTA